MKKGNKYVSLTLSALAMVMPLAANAQVSDDPLLNETDSVVNTSQIDIDGYYNTNNQNQYQQQNTKKVTEADRIQKLRRDLEEKHEQMMRKRVEDMRLEEERKLARKLQDALNGQMNAMDQVSTVSAAPVKTEVKVEEVKKEESLKNSVTISGGFLNISSETNDFEASANIRLGIDSKVSERFSVGVGVRYVSFDTEDGNNSYLSSSNYYGSYYYPYYTSSQYQTRTINFKQLSFDISSKVFLTVDSKVKPFLGATLAYNRGTFKYEDNDNYTIGSYQYGDEKVTNNNFSAAAVVGAQVEFSKSVSAELNVMYERALNSGVSELTSEDTPDEQRLRNLAFDLEDADIASINLGLSIHF